MLVVQHDAPHSPKIEAGSKVRLNKAQLVGKRKKVDGGMLGSATRLVLERTGDQVRPIFWCGTIPVLDDANV